jgi:hypothetical protein
MKSWGSLRCPHVLRTSLNVSCRCKTLSQSREEYLDGKEICPWYRIAVGVLFGLATEEVHGLR